MGMMKNAYVYICTVSGMVEYLLMVNVGKYTSPMDPIMKFGMY